MQTRAGGCECGLLRYEIHGDPKVILVCHCRSCQRQSGSAFGMSMLFAQERFRVTSGALKTFERVGHSGVTMQCRFCPECGTRIVQQKASMPGIVILKPGTLDETCGVAPNRQLWTGCRQGWVQLADLPGFETQPS